MLILPQGHSRATGDPQESELLPTPTRQLLNTRLRAPDLPPPGPPATSLCPVPGAGRPLQGAWVLATPGAGTPACPPDHSLSGSHWGSKTLASEGAPRAPRPHLQSGTGPRTRRVYSGWGGPCPPLPTVSMRRPASLGLGVHVAPTEQGQGKGTPDSPGPELRTQWRLHVRRAWWSRGLDKTPARRTGQTPLVRPHRPSTLSCAHPAVHTAHPHCPVYTILSTPPVHTSLSTPPVRTVLSTLSCPHRPSTPRCPLRPSALSCLHYPVHTRPSTSIVSATPVVARQEGASRGRHYTIQRSPDCGGSGHRSYPLGPQPIPAGPVWGVEVG